MITKSIFKISILLILLSLILFSDIIATINHKDITREDVDYFIKKSLPGASYELMSNTDKKKVVNTLIDRALYLDIAKKDNIEADEEYQKVLKRESENLMLTIWMKKRTESISVTDEEVKEYYNTHDHEFRQVAAASARHILVQTLFEARNIIAQLKNSKNLKKHFISLAKQLSTGPSAINGGDLGWFNHDQMVKEFSDAAMKLKIGEISTSPVKTHFGYHVIYLTDKHPAGKIELEKVQETIKKVIRAKKFKKYLEQLQKTLKKSAKISVK